jgi:CheY-like chemotaxis protein
LPGTCIGEPAPVTGDAVVRCGAMCRVLIVDDNADSAESLEMILQLLGHETLSLTDPRKALDVSRTFQPDLVFLDIGMPGMSGYDVARALRADSVAPAQVKLVALTGWGQPEDRRRSEESGFDYHVVKPAELKVIEQICQDVASHAPPPRTASRAVK